MRNGTGFEFCGGLPPTYPAGLPSLGFVTTGFGLRTAPPLSIFLFLVISVPHMTQRAEARVLDEVIHLVALVSSGTIRRVTSHWIELDGEVRSGQGCH